jgi:TetR/AcrR family transcriptional regulator, ethionamide resistance regulator
VASTSVSAPAEPTRAASGRADRRKRREQVRADVLRAALELAESSSFRDLTVDEIARAAGISRSAFYTHFRDKHDLLRVAVEEVADELYRMADRWWHGSGPPAERVRVALEGVVAVYAENAGLLRIATEVSTYDEEVRELWLTIVERFIEATADHIRAEQSKGLIQPALEPRATAESLVWMNERVSYIYLGRGERRPAEVVEAMAPVWTAALYPGVITADELRPGLPGAADDEGPEDLPE